MDKEYTSIVPVADEKPNNIEGYQVFGVISMESIKKQSVVIGVFRDDILFLKDKLKNSKTARFSWKDFFLLLLSLGGGAILNNVTIGMKVIQYPFHYIVEFSLIVGGLVGFLFSNKGTSDKLEWSIEACTERLNKYDLEASK